MNIMATSINDPAAGNTPESLINLLHDLFGGEIIKVRR